jgi:hypothetical protein
MSSTTSETSAQGGRRRPVIFSRKAWAKLNRAADRSKCNNEFPRQSTVHTTITEEIATPNKVVTYPLKVRGIRLLDLGCSRGSERSRPHGDHTSRPLLDRLHHV